MSLGEQNKYPSYLNLAEGGQLMQRVKKGLELLRECRLCPRNCGVNRVKGEKGFCRTGRWAQVSSAVPHHGEEPCISGRYGSGTIFFTHCNLRCIFCQNYDISQQGYGREVSPEELSELMLALQRKGCHNINLVTPSHVGVQILEALQIAADKGLQIPIVWNSGGFDGLQTLSLMDGVVDIYMPDLKYSRSDSASELSKAPDYFERAKEALREMYRQVGDFEVGPDGVARHGLLVRHLVLPNDTAGSEECLRFLSEELSPRIGLSLLSQYRPTYQAWKVESISRPLRREEYLKVARLVQKLGFQQAFIQHMGCENDWFPDFSKEDPFEAYRKKREER